MDAEGAIGKMSVGIGQEGPYLVGLLRSALHAEAAPAAVRDLDWLALHQLAVRHGVANLAYYGLQLLPSGLQPSATELLPFQLSHRRAIAREATQQVAVEQILAACEQHDLACLPVKGVLLKQLYPRPDMRLMVDIDFLVKSEQTQLMRQLMQAQGYAVQHQGGNHDVYHRQPYLNVEIHHRLVAESSPYCAYLSRSWQRAVRESGRQQVYRLPPEDHYVYLLIHLAKHYTKGGAGLRSFLDIWVYVRYYGETMNWDYIQSELAEIGLSQFEGKVRESAAVWFGGGEDRDSDPALLAFSLESGLYGTREHAVLAGLSTSRHRCRRLAKLAYWWQWLFPPAAVLQMAYPWLLTRPLLLPAAWCLRAARRLRLLPRQLCGTVVCLVKISPQRVEETEQLWQRMGLS